MVKKWCHESRAHLEVGSRRWSVEWHLWNEGLDDDRDPLEDATEHVAHFPTEANARAYALELDGTVDQVWSATYLEEVFEGGRGNSWGTWEQTGERHYPNG